jgi:hypothetical protein
MSITAVTEGTLNGKGVFDVLMRAAKEHLNEEYKKNRFSGEDYANLYLGTMNAVLQQSIQYALTADQSAAQATLLEAQTDKTRREEAVVAQQLANLATEGKNLVKVGLKLDEEVQLTAKQTDKLAADIDLTERQEANLKLQGTIIPLEGIKLQGEINTLQYQDQKIQEETLMVEQQRLNATAEGLNIPKQGLLIDAQTAKTNADAAASTANVNVLTATAAKVTADEAQIQAAIAKINKEVEVLDQRRKTEIAQTADMVDGITVSGVLGKQKALYAAQTDGFARDAEQKLAKLMVDVWSVQRTTDEGISPAGAGLADSEIQRVVQKAKTGIGVV